MIAEAGEGRINIRLGSRQGEGHAAVAPCTNRGCPRQGHGHGPVRHAQLHRAQVAVHISHAEPGDIERRVFVHRLRPRHRVHRRVVHGGDNQRGRIGRCGEGCRAAVGRGVGQRAVATASLIPGAERDGIGDRPVVIGVGLEEEPRVGIGG